MRVRNKDIFLKFDFVHSSPDTTVEVYDNSFNPIYINQDCTISTTLPNKIIIRLLRVCESELTKISLAGIKISAEKLQQIIEYKTCKYKLQTPSDLEKFPSQRTTKCNKDGYLVLNLFHRNPFAIHLYAGNTINFKL